MNILLNDIEQKIVVARKVIIGISGSALRLKDGSIISIDDPNGQEPLYDTICDEYDYPVTHHLD